MEKLDEMEEEMQKDMKEKKEGEGLRKKILRSKIASDLFKQL